MPVWLPLGLGSSSWLPGVLPISTQLKLFAKTRSITPGISDSYEPKAENNATVQQFHAKHKDISRMLMSSQIVFPLVVIVWSVVLLVYYLHHHKLASDYDKLYGKEKHSMQVKLSILFAIAFTISLYAFIMSILAYARGDKKLDEDTKLWYNRDTQELKTLNSIIATIMVEDILIFTVLVSFGIILSCCSICSDDSSCLWGFCTCSIIAPAANLAVHANHIVFAFIHNQEHAVSIGIFYVIVISTNIHVMHVTCSFLPKEVANFFPLINLGLSLFINLFYAYVGAIYVMLPINNGFDAAPDRIRLIYNSLIVSFIAAFTYWFIIKKKKDD